MCSKVELAYQCRLCTKFTGEFTEIFGENADDSLAKMINSSLPIHVAENDLLPKLICLTCKQIIEEFDLFRQSCVWSDQLLRSSVNNSQPSLFESEDCIKQNAVNSYSMHDKLAQLTKNGVEAIPESYRKDVHVDSCGNIVTTPVECKSLPEDSADDIAIIYDSTDLKKADIKEPQPEDFVLVKEEIFVINNFDKCVSDNVVEFCKRNPEIHDRDLVQELYKKRQVLPQMWDVFEKNTKSDDTVVTHRRYIISKAAFPCSLCSDCINIKCTDDSLENIFGFPSENKNEEVRNIDGHFENMMGNISEVATINKAECTTEIATGYVIKNEIEHEVEDATEDSMSHMIEDMGYDITKSEFKSVSEDISVEVNENVSEDRNNITITEKEVNGGTHLCNFCSEQFIGPFSLHQHFCTYFRCKPYLCNLCGQAFRRKEHMTRHTFLHTGRRPFACKKCEKRFTRKEHLVRHQIVHNTQTLKKMRQSRKTGSDDIHASGGHITKTFSTRGRLCHRSNVEFCGFCT